MLSKEKIKIEALSFYRKVPSYIDQDKCFIEGAEWASKQYEGVVKALETFMADHEENIDHNDNTYKEAKQELDKLKQP